LILASMSWEAEVSEFALFVAFFMGACVFMRLLSPSAYMRRPGKWLACATQAMNWPSSNSSFSRISK
jgi:hypothetical protein